MVVTREELLAVLYSRGQDYRAAKVAAHFPAMIDSAQHGHLLEELGLDLDHLFGWRTRQPDPYDGLGG